LGALLRQTCLTQRELFELADNLRQSLAAFLFRGDLLPEGRIHFP
jgi:hypothetical protein